MHSLRDMLPDLLQTKSKSSLAKALGVSRPTLDRYIKEPDSMSLKTLRILADLKGYKIKLIQSDNNYTL